MIKDDPGMRKTEMEKVGDTGDIYISANLLASANF